MAKYRMILNKISKARRKSWWVLPACVLSNRGITFSVISVAVWNVQCKFSKIFPFTIHLAYLGSCLFTGCLFTKASESQQMAEQYP